MGTARFRLALAVALSLTHSPTAALPHSRLVTVEQARSLAYEALTPREKRLGFDFMDDQARPDERYLVITLVPSRGEGVLNFAVDRKTGDVWSAASSCLEMTNSRLRGLQAKLRRQLGVSRSEYARLKTHEPLCDN
jgi:hypothetical protein